VYDSRTSCGPRSRRSALSRLLAEPGGLDPSVETSIINLARASFGITPDHSRRDCLDYGIHRETLGTDVDEPTPERQLELLEQMAKRLYQQRQSMVEVPIKEDLIDQLRSSFQCGFPNHILGVDPDENEFSVSNPVTASHPMDEERVVSALTTA
jgi:hypothetical protein